MRTRHGTIALTTLVLTSVLTVVHATSQQAQVDQITIARQLFADHLEERSRALEAAAAIGAEKITPELRAALIALLERQNRIVEQAAKRDEPLEVFENPEFIARVSHVVAQLGDPQAIPALAEAIYGGGPVIRALSKFGEQAVPAVINVVTSSESHYNAVDHGLMTLRFMVEQAGTRPLSAGTLDQIRGAAEQRLMGKQSASTLWHAIDLAVVLGDADLRRVLELLAVDINAVFARGVENPDLIERTQKRAADRLAGIPPLPRP